MAQQTTYTCDECGKQRGDANHWWLATFLSNVQIEYASDFDREHGMAFAKWSEEGSRQPHAFHLCGNGCATKLLSKWMSR